MKRNATNATLFAKDGPRFDVEFILENILLSLSDGQLSGFLMLLDEIQRHLKMQANMHLRPEMPVSQRYVLLICFFNAMLHRRGCSELSRIYYAINVFSERMKKMLK